MPTPVQPTDAVQLSPGLGYVDLPRTAACSSDVYHWQTATRAAAVRLGRCAVRVDPAALRGGLRRIGAGVRAGGRYGARELADSVARQVNRELNGRSID